MKPWTKFAVGEIKVKEANSTGLIPAGAKIDEMDIGIKNKARIKIKDYLTKLIYQRKQKVHNICIL